MKPNPKTGGYFVLMSVACVLMMFATRLTTLSFGRVFPEVAPATARRIADLEKRNTDLDAENRRLKETPPPAAPDPVVQRQYLVYLWAGSQLIRIDKEFTEEPSEEYVRQVAVRVDHELARKATHTPTPSEAAIAKTGQTTKTAQGDAVVHRGDRQARVRAIFGKPESVNTYFDHEVWTYGIGKRVKFRNGSVSEWDDMPVEP